jgi:capsular polysaccharide transport system ATP-binding protein
MARLWKKEALTRGEILRTSRVCRPLGFMGRSFPKAALTKRRYIRHAGFVALCRNLLPRYLCGIEEYFDMPVGTYSQGMARFSFFPDAGAGILYLIDLEDTSTTDAEFNRKAGSILHAMIAGRDRDRQPSTADPRTVLPALPCCRDGRTSIRALEEARRLYGNFTVPKAL